VLSWYYWGLLVSLVANIIGYWLSGDLLGIILTLVTSDVRKRNGDSELYVGGMRVRRLAAGRRCIKDKPILAAVWLCDGHDFI